MGAQSTPKRRKNVLLIVTDDQEPQTVMNMPKTVTQMIKKGVKFSRGQVTTPQCGPSRCSMLTGKFVHNHGCTDNVTKGDKNLRPAQAARHGLFIPKSRAVYSPSQRKQGSVVLRGKPQCFTLTSF